MNKKYLICGGGSGGHIFPAISIANEIKLKIPNCEFLFVGAKNMMEMKKVPESGYRIEGLWISGYSRKFSFKNFIFFIKLFHSLIMSFIILIKFKPNIVIGTGGYVSGPVIFIASILKIPTIIQEQNSYPGITNRILSNFVNFVCVAYEGLDKYFPKEKIIFTGNPIRKEIQNFHSKSKTIYKKISFDSSKITVLILGGSLGSKRINEIISSNLDWFKLRNIQLIWQTGELYYDDYVTKYDNYDSKIIIKPFLKSIYEILSISDVVISRSGAIAISEFMALGKSTILIPSPNVSEDHQNKNAEHLKSKKATILVKEENIEKLLFNELEKLTSSKDKREFLSKNIKKMYVPNASSKIVELIKKISL